MKVERGKHHRTVMMSHLNGLRTIAPTKPFQAGHDLRMSPIESGRYGLAEALRIMMRRSEHRSVIVQVLRHFVLARPSVSHALHGLEKTMADQPAGALRRLCFEVNLS